MRATNTFGVHFTLRQSKRNDSKSNLYARITVNKTRCEISLKTNVKREDWNERKGSAKPKNDELKQLNSYLEEIRAKLVSHYREIKLANGLLSADVIKNAYSSAGNNNDSKSLLWLAEEHNKVMQEIIKPGTMKNYYTTARYLGYFLSQKFPSGDISLEELKCEFITAFEYFIRCNAIKKNDPCTNNGTMKHLERLKKMITWAFKNEWIKKTHSQISS